MQANDKIDLDNLTVRELLVKLHLVVTELKCTVDSLTNKEVENRVKIATLETRAKIYGAVSGFVCSAITSIIVIIIKSITNG